MLLTVGDEVYIQDYRVALHRPVLSMVSRQRWETYFEFAILNCLDRMWVHTFLRSFLNSANASLEISLSIHVGIRYFPRTQRRATSKNFNLEWQGRHAGKERLLKESSQSGRPVNNARNINSSRKQKPH